MDINQLRRQVNLLNRDQLFELQQQIIPVRLGVNRLLHKPVREHLLVATNILIKERLEGIKPSQVHTQRRPTLNGKCTTRKVSIEEMEKLWVM